MRFASVVLLALLAVGCGDDGPSEPPEPEFEGAWSGTIPSYDAAMDLTVSENSDGDINGNGVLSGGMSIAVSVHGVHSHPNVSFTATATGYEDLNFSGSFSGDDTVNGTLNGSGFSNTSVTFRRD